MYLFAELPFKWVQSINVCLQELYQRDHTGHVQRSVFKAVAYASRRCQCSHCLSPSLRKGGQLTHFQQVGGWHKSYHSQHCQHFQLTCELFPFCRKRTARWEPYLCHLCHERQVCWCAMTWTSHSGCSFSLL